ncbi:5-dehydro-4-deoxy-D-glucuronate isomerase [Kribbella albertanoniae]|uniref:5-dehydro-4-deoxy-D-glucuronate isomerase n=1 Tax=Kribbella albertanoniae TaxID=1266829 RepID=UPI001EDD92B1|nr:5-dehydro-4-deoxy-D-glucuronate isomerase [Kribbella albertanoniae]
MNAQSPLQIRHATHPAQVPGFDTAGLRAQYLVDDLFTPDAVTAVLTHHDRIVLAGAVPASGPLTLNTWPELRSEYFLERREAGIVNVGGPGTVTADGTKYELTTGACLYVGRGTREVIFEGTDSAFYVFSANAHTEFPTALVNPGEGNRLELGDQQTANRRTIDQYIHAGGVQSCQVVLGVTTLHAGSTWNTMPAHTHDRRTECYLYFGLPETERIVHLLGEPDETRHLLVADRQAIISPSWSIHSGVGTSSYSFVWAMAGENQAFTDMDGVDVRDLR